MSVTTGKWKGTTAACPDGCCHPDEEEFDTKEEAGRFALDAAWPGFIISPEGDFYEYENGEWVVEA